ncbi:hypothetical protein RND81_05G272300 [Saponaria officinalis]|uniref:PRA1 family protein n=1 Tax=Saponaria officinalis TaxID=3572 RepID=A0AAW1L2P9_SAPOF
MSSPLLQIPKCVSLNPSFRMFVFRANESAHRASASRQPWSDLFDYDSFSRPPSLSEGASRIRNNLSYFRINYLVLLAGLLALSLISHPLSLISLLLLISAWLFLYFFKPSDHPLILCSHTFSNNETLALLVVATFLLLFFTSVGSLLISTTLLGGAIICIHGAFRDPVRLFLDGQDEASSTGFFSISNQVSIKSASAAVLDVAALV